MSFTVLYNGVSFGKNAKARLNKDSIAPNHNALKEESKAGEITTNRRIRTKTIIEMITLLKTGIGGFSWFGRSESTTFR